MAGKVKKALDPVTDASLGYEVSQTLPYGMQFKDVGSTGLRQYGGWVREEFLPQLQGRLAVQMYREMMDNSPTVGAVMFAIIQVLREIDWRVEPANDSGAALAEQEFVDSLREDMSHTWADFLIEALSMLGYGFAPCEIVYKRRNGRKPPSSPSPSSKFDDGLIGWRRLPIRGQDTILKWFFDQNGQIKGLTQQPWVGSMIDIPIQKMLLFRPQSHKNNPEGRSILRTAYRPWYFQKRLEEQEAILLERMSGIPMVKVPNKLLVDAANNVPQARAALDAYKRIATNVRIDEQMGLVFPSDTFDGPTGKSNIPMYDFTLVVPQGSGRAGSQFDAPITRHALNIMTSVLADFLSLGHSSSSRGAQTVGIQKVDMFYNAIASWMDSMASVMNNYALPRLWELNGKDFDLMPQLAPDLAQRVDLDSLGNFMLHLSQAGMPLFPDPDLENWTREAAGLPDISEESAYHVLYPDPESSNRQQIGPVQPQAADGGDAGTEMSQMQKMILGSLARRAKTRNFFQKSLRLKRGGPASPWRPGRRR